MNGFLLLIPLLLIRYGLISLINKEALSRAAHFPPMCGGEKAAFWVYQLSTVAIFVYAFFLKVQVGTALFYIGLAIYAIGIILCAAGTVNFANAPQNGFSNHGIYRVSRNPMYVAYFIYLLGCVLLTRSVVLFAVLILFQISTHWIILSEERWCKEKFGTEYIQYMKMVRRYV